MIPRKYAPGRFLALLGFLMVSPLSHSQEPQKPMVYEGTVGGLRFLEEGQPPAMIHATVDDMKRFREANPHARPGVQAANTANDLTYHGGIGGIGVETPPKIYVVFWGPGRGKRHDSQWNNNDPSGEAAILQSFYSGVGGSSSLNSVTQYCVLQQCGYSRW
jgi:serine protease